MGSFKDRNPPDIKGTGYVVEALEAALWAFHNSDDFREGALLAVNLGDDADTTGAIYGQIAGAHHGAQPIPSAWRDKLTMAAEITSLTDRLHDQAGPASRRRAWAGFIARQRIKVASPGCWFNRPCCSRWAGAT